MNRNRVAAIVVACVVIVSAGAVYLFYSYWPSDPSPGWDYIGYRVNTTIDIQYEILLPIPVDGPNEAWYLVGNLSLREGNASWTPVTTPYGLTLRIVGKGNVSIYTKAPARGFSYLGLSPQNRTSGELRRTGSIPYLIFANASGMEDSISFAVSIGCAIPGGVRLGSVVSVLQGEVHAGWQEIWGTGFVAER